jgi:uncharacterized membrane protein YciS (DUF1049 family)
MRKVKLIAIFVVAILTIVILAQNTKPVEARILFAKPELSLALLMLLTFALGFIIGILVPTYLLRKTNGKGRAEPSGKR